nr:hypothetical protein [uncultured Prevotella sp.]
MNKGRVTITGPSPMVQQMAQQNYAIKNGGDLPMQGAPGGASTPVAPQPVDMNFFGGNGGATGKYEAPAKGASPDLTPDSKAPDPKYGTGGVQFANPSGTDKNDLSSLSAALNSAGVSSPSSGREFTADDTKRDGGFFGWIKGLAPKFRPGRRDGETDEEYDMRHTQNMQRLATFADAIRHMGNIVNTYKGGPLQRFNDPTDYLLAGYEKRNAERRQQDAADRDMAYNQATLNLKERAAEAKNAYDQLNLLLKQNGATLSKDKFDYQKAKDAAAAKAKAEKEDRDFKYKQERDKVKDKQTEKRLGIAEYNATHKGRGGGGRSGSGSGSGRKYWFEDKNGKIRYQPNKTMWEQEYYREYGRLPQGESSTSVTTKTTNYRTGAEVTTTTRRKGASVTSQAAASQNAAKRARNKPKSTQKHNALNNWFKKNYK